MFITSINKGNKALEYIEKRIKDIKYRGAHSSQHQRYKMDDIYEILKKLKSYVGDDGFLTIRNTDLSKRPKNDIEEFKYAKFCDEVVHIVGKGTQDAMRKLFFVDMHRMGFIKRFNKKNIKCTDPFQKCLARYVSITEFGNRFLNTDKKLLNRYFIFSKAIDNLFSGRIEIILNLLLNGLYKTNNLFFDEYMFFASAIEIDTDFSVSVSEADDLITEYRILSPIQRKTVVDILNEQLDPKKFDGNKNNKRDFHNWKNQTDQVFHLLNQTVYFEVRGTDNDALSKRLILKGKKCDTFSGISKRLNRSMSEKKEYIKNHKIKNKVSGFEFHHVVPLARSENIHHFKILDKWENIVYIDAFSHAKITQNNNRNIVMSINNNDIVLTDFSEEQIYLEYRTNIAYDITQQKVMKEYNIGLINTVHLDNEKE